MLRVKECHVRHRTCVRRSKVEDVQVLLLYERLLLALVQKKLVDMVLFYTSRGPWVTVKLVWSRLIRTRSGGPARGHIHVGSTALLWKRIRMY